MEYKFGQFSPEHLSKMKDGIRLFNQQHYWECHEVLEDLWMEDRNDPARYIYWAIIQIAASCIHVRDGNIVGARGMLFKAKKKFQSARENHVLTDQVFQFLDWAELEEIVFSIKETDAELSDFVPLFNFRFKSYPEVVL